MLLLDLMSRDDHRVERKGPRLQTELTAVFRLEVPGS